MTAPKGSWNLSFDASTRQMTGAGYAEWAWVLKGGKGDVMLSQHGAAVSEPLSNCVAEWEGLVAGLSFLASGRLGGMTGLSITGDERVVIAQLHGRAVCRDPLRYWRDEALSLLSLIALPWSAEKVSRSRNAAADAAAGG